AYLVTFLDELRLAHDGGADVVLLQVQRQPVEPIREFDELTGLHLVQAIDAGDTVARGQDHARLADLEALLVISDLLADDVADLRRADLHALSSPCPGPGPWLAPLGHLIAHSKQLCAETAAPARPADVQHDAPEQLRIDLG